MGETHCNPDKLCESRCSHVHSDRNQYHLPKSSYQSSMVTLSTGLHWQSFETSVHTNKSVREEDILTYLCAAIKDKCVSDILGTLRQQHLEKREYDPLITDLNTMIKDIRYTKLM